MTPTVAAVAVPRPIDRTFDYAIPESMPALCVGVRVRVKFGRETVVGYVVGVKASSEFEGKLQPILGVLDEHPILDEAALKLAWWLRVRYLCPLGLVLQAMLPRRLGPAKPSQRKRVVLNLSLPQTMRLIEDAKLQAPQQARLLEALLNTPNPPMAELLARINASDGPLRALAEREVVRLEPLPATAFSTPFDEQAKSVTLSTPQQTALDCITDALHAEGGKGFLLQGVNGSGKTEVYVRAVVEALRLGKSALVLTPEISLTPQLINRFRHRLGDRLAVLHSGLTPAQQAREWTRLREGEAQAVLGVRSASLLPIEDLGLVVVDEEHESTYRQDAPEPRYHAREVLLHRCKSENLVLVLGSATPSLNAHHAVEQGQLTRLTLPERLVPAPKSLVEVVDIAEQRGWLSPLLKERIENTLAAGRQAMLMLNRKGFGVAFCKRCKRTLRCPSCDICLVYQAKSSQLRCHYCDYVRRSVSCLTCDGEVIAVGAGTQQIELSLKKRFPGARVVRMDADAIKRGQHGGVLEAFRRGEIDILLGTQMLAVGHDFPNVQLMGIVDADTLLHVPDYAASERTFQLINQAMGRAGRGDEQAHVVVQTRHADHYALRCAIAGDYEGFVSEEKSLREALGYPPFTQLIWLQSSHRDPEKAQSTVEQLKADISTLDVVDVLGPTKGLPYRWRGDHRWRLLVKTRKDAVAREAIWKLIKKSGLDGQLRIEVEG